MQAAIRSLGYVPSGNARALAGKRTGVVGLLLPGFDVVPDERPDLVTDGGVRVVDDRRHVTQPFSSNLYFDEVLRGAETEAWQRGLALMVAAGRGSSRDVIVNDVAGRVDGLAVLAQTVPDDLLEHVARRIPVVVLADDRRSHGFDSVSVDNAAGMRTLGVARHRAPGDPVPRVRRGAHRLARTTWSARRASAQALGRPRGAGFDGAHRARRLRAGSGAGARGVSCSTPTTSHAPIVCSNDQSALGVLDAAAGPGRSGCPRTSS